MKILHIRLCFQNTIVNATKYMYINSILKMSNQFIPSILIILYLMIAKIPVITCNNKINNNNKIKRNKLENSNKFLDYS